MIFLKEAEVGISLWSLDFEYSVSGDMKADKGGGDGKT